MKGYNGEPFVGIAPQPIADVRRCVEVASERRSREHAMYKVGAEVLVLNPWGTKRPGKVVACRASWACSIVTVVVDGETQERRLAGDRVEPAKKGKRS